MTDKYELEVVPDEEPPKNALQLSKAILADYEEGAPLGQNLMTLLDKHLAELAQDESRLWDVYAPVYHPALKRIYHYKRLQTDIRSLLSLQPNQNIVDLGSGAGGFWKDEKTKGLDITAVDLSGSMLVEARRDCPHQIKIRCHNLNEPLNFIESNSTHRILCANALSFLQDADSARQLIGEMSRIINPAMGRIVLATSKQGYNSNMILRGHYLQQNPGVQDDPAEWTGTSPEDYARIYEKAFSGEPPEAQKDLLLALLCNIALRKIRGGQVAASYLPTEAELRGHFEHSGLEIETFHDDAYAGEYFLLFAVPASRSSIKNQLSKPNSG